MKPELQRVKIAEACKLAGQKMPTFMDDDGCRQEGMPDYLNSLDAMAEAINVLTPAELDVFVTYLFDKAQELAAADKQPDKPLAPPWGQYMVKFKATDFAEAFLRTKELWEEGEGE